MSGVRGVSEANKKASRWLAFLFGGEGEIRTRGELPHACFQDKYLKPLGHLSIQDYILTEVSSIHQVVERILNVCTASSTVAGKTSKYKINDGIGE